MLRPRCACSNLAAHAPTSLRLLQPRCTCADLAAHAPSLAAHALKLRMLRASLRMLQNLAAHALTPNLAAHAPRVTTVYTRRKKLIWQQYIYFQVFIFANKIIMLNFWVVSRGKYIFSFDFWLWKKITPVKNTYKPVQKRV